MQKIQSRRSIQSERSATKYATRWLARYKEIEALKARQKETAAILIGLMRAQGANHVNTSSREGVVLTCSKSKRPAKKDIVAFFGKARGQAFWEEVPDSISEYLSPIQAGARR